MDVFQHVLIIVVVVVVVVVAYISMTKISFFSGDAGQYIKYKVTHPLPITFNG